MSITQGWQHLIDVFEQEIDIDASNGYAPYAEIIQIEDLGSRLIINYSGGNERTDSYARIVQELSKITCKECGKPGEFKFIPVCDDCQ